MDVRVGQVSTEFHLSFGSNAFTPVNCSFYMYMHASHYFFLAWHVQASVHMRKVFKCKLYTNIILIKISYYSSQTLQMIKYELFEIAV